MPNVWRATRPPSTRRANSPAWGGRRNGGKIVSRGEAGKLSERSDFYGESSVLVDPLQEQRESVIVDVFVNRFPVALPVPIIIDDQNASNRESRIQMNQLVSGRLVPVGIEPENGNRVRRLLWQGVFHFSLDEAQAIGGITRRCQIGAHVIERCVGPYQGRLVGCR